MLITAESEKYLVDRAQPRRETKNDTRSIEVDRQKDVSLPARTAWSHLRLGHSTWCLYGAAGSMVWEVQLQIVMMSR